MYKYQSFCEYLQFNYSEHFKESLEEHIKAYETALSQRKGKNCDGVYINNLSVTSSRFIKNKIDYVEFIALINVDYSVLRDVFSGEFDNYSKAFTVTMGGSFADGFEQITSKEYDGSVLPEKLTQGLVPVISNAEMDSYADKFLSEFCPEMLEKPMALPVDEILKSKGISYYYAPLDNDIFAKTFFAIDKALVYQEENENRTAKQIVVYPGTILVNLSKHESYPEGVLRNTIVHELVHWYFHRNYFALRQCLNPEDTCVACCKGKSEVFTNDIDWMEWQARSLAPRILMPKKMALLQYDNICRGIETINAIFHTKPTDTQWHSMVLDKFADFFQVSKESARIRLIELGKTGFDGVEKYVDGTYIASFTYKKRSLKKNQTYTISARDLFNLLSTNIQIKEALVKEKLIYANKMLVVNNPKFFDAEKYELTEYALSHADECCVVFDINFQSMTKAGVGSYLFNGSKFNKLTTNPEAVGQLLMLADENAAHFEKHKKELPDSFAETLLYHYKKSKENYEVKSYEDFEFKTGITAKSIRTYMNGSVVPDRITIIKMSLALKLSAPYIMDLLQKSDQMITLMNGDNLILFTIIYGYQRIGLEETYRQLERTGRGYILNLPESFIKEITY